MSKPKPILNKFDQYEVQAALQETAENFLNANFKRVNRLFYIKCILGVLLTFNIYLSHWYPIPWPKSYFLYIFCVVFYYAASYYYESLDIIPKSKGGFIGEYDQGNKTVRKYTLEFKPFSPEMSLKMYTRQKKQLKSLEFQYNEYIDEDGTVQANKFNELVKKLAESKLE